MKAVRRSLVVVFCIHFSIALPLVNNARADVPPETIVTFSASDHGFDGPDTLPAGLTTLRLENRGRETHQLQLLKLTDGKTPAELMEFLQGPVRAIPSWAKHVGGPNGVGPGGSAEATVYLGPGSYVLICAFPSKAEKSHLVIPKPLRVIEGGASLREFTGNVHMAMLDYEFVVVEHMRKGEHTFYVINRGTQRHQVSLVRLDPGASAKDLLDAFAQLDTRPIPGTFIGGMAGLEPGAVGMFTAALSHGRYAMICLFPAPGSPDSHASKGMVMDFTIE